uniref:Uncharacterized protein n=1 Tax=Cacopsylla melanoneura TaxID=428564 RepID=A0A8D8ZB53_9HEMI
MLGMTPSCAMNLQANVLVDFLLILLGLQLFSDSIFLEPSWVYYIPVQHLVPFDHLNNFQSCSSPNCRKRSLGASFPDEGIGRNRKPQLRGCKPDLESLDRIIVITMYLGGRVV